MRIGAKPNVSKLAAKRDLDGLIKARDYWHREVVTQMCLASQAEHTIGPQTRTLSRIRDAGLLPPDVSVTIRSALYVYAKATEKRNRAMDEEETAVTSLGEIGGPRAIESLISALCDSSRDFHYTQHEWCTMQAAIAALKRAGPAAVEPLIGILRDENPQVRDSAARALGSIDDPRAVESLINVLQNEPTRTPDARLAKVRCADTEAPGTIGDPRAVQPPRTKGNKVGNGPGGFQMLKQAKAMTNLRRASSVMVDSPNTLVMSMLVNMTGIGAICRIQRLGRRVRFTYREGDNEPLTFMRVEPSVRRDLKRLTDLYERQQANPLTHMSIEDEERAFREADLPWWGLKV